MAVILRGQEQQSLKLQDVPRLPMLTSFLILLGMHLVQTGHWVKKLMQSMTTVEL